MGLELLARLVLVVPKPLLPETPDTQGAWRGRDRTGSGMDAINSVRFNLDYNGTLLWADHRTDRHKHNLIISDLP
jgi:hypothetical protein